MNKIMMLRAKAREAIAEYGRTKDLQVAISSLSAIYVAIEEALETID